MKLKSVLTGLAIAASVAVAPASWANTLTFQDVTFNLYDSGSNTLTLEVNGVSGASGDWTGIDGLANFELKDLGSATFNSTTALAGWTASANALGAGNLCASGGTTNSGCFTYNSGSYVLSNNNTFVITYSGTLDLTAPHLKVYFTGADTGDGHGNLLSQTIPGTSVPEPASLMLLGAGLAGIGIWRRKAVKI